MSNMYNKLLKNHLLLSFILLFVLSIIIYNFSQSSYEGFRRRNRRERRFRLRRGRRRRRRRVTNCGRKVQARIILKPKGLPSLMKTNNTNFLVKFYNNSDDLTHDINFNKPLIENEENIYQWISAPVKRACNKRRTNNLYIKANTSYDIPYEYITLEVLSGNRKTSKTYTNGIIKGNNQVNNFSYNSIRLQRHLIN